MNARRLSRRYGLVVALLAVGAVTACKGAAKGVQLDYDVAHPLRFSVDGKVLVAAVGSLMTHLRVDGDQLSALSATGFMRLEITDVATTRDHSLVAAAGNRTIHLSRGVGPSGGGGMIKTPGGGGALRPRGMIWSVDFSPDGRWLASSSGVHEVESWALAKRLATPRDRFDQPASRPSSASQPAALFGTSEMVRFVRFSADGKHLFVVGDGQDHFRIVVLSVPDWKVTVDQELRGLRVPAMSMAGDLAPDGTLALGGSSVLLVRITGGKAVTEPLPVKGPQLTSLAFYDGGKRLAAVSRHEVGFWDVHGRRLLHSVKTQPAPRFLRVAAHPSGRFIAVSRSDNFVEVIKTPDQ